MSLQAMVRSALGTIGGLLPETLLTVIYNGRTATGISFKSAHGEALEDYGERGTSRGRVIIDASKIDLPEKGAQILVDGKNALTSNITEDPTSGSITIDFQYLPETT